MASFPRRRLKVDVVAAGAGDTQVVAAISGKKIALMGYVIVASAAGVNPKWRSAANDLSGPMPFAANGGATCGLSPDGEPWLMTNSGEALNINAAGAGNVGGHIVYEERPY